MSICFDKDVRVDIPHTCSSTHDCYVVVVVVVVVERGSVETEKVLWLLDFGGRMLVVEIR